VVAVSGHTGPMDRVRFHPKESNLLCTTAQDRTVRIWDLRAGSQRSLGIIGLLSSARYSSCPASVEWSSGNLLVLTERDDSIHVYDTRKLHSAPSRGGGGRTPTPVQSYPMGPYYLVEGCQFSPNSDYLVAATTPRGDGMSELRIWPWKGGMKSNDHMDNATTYPGHTGPIYQFSFSLDGTKLVTGGSDAIVGLWDVHSMICAHTITRRTKFIRSVAFSHDSRLLASSSEDDGIDLADSTDGGMVGTIGLVDSRRGGADEISFHPSAHVLACARGDNMMGGGSSSAVTAPVTVARLTIS